MRHQIVIRIDRRAAVIVLAAALLAASALRLSSETLTLSTSYPAPVGVYNQIVTTGNSGSTPADTTLNRNAGNTIVALSPTGRLGVGTPFPAARLDVSGDARVTGNAAVTGTVSAALVLNPAYAP
jgi:hypothetical protein